MWLLLTKEIDSDLKAKKEFIRSVWGGRSSLGLKGDCRAMFGTEKSLAGLQAARTFKQNTQFCC